MSKILVITASLRAGSNSDILAERLIAGEDSFRVHNQEEIASEKNAASFESVGPTLT